MARAAERIGIAQPALSQQIRALEEALGFKLFHRRKRGIDLTAAGRAYRQSAARLIAMHREAALSARMTARGELGHLAIGYVPSALFSRWHLAIGYVPSALFSREFPQVLHRLQSEFPGIAVELREGQINDLSRDLGDGRIDIALLRAPVRPAEGQEQLLLAPRALLVALPHDHPLAQRKSLVLADLADLPMVSYNDPTDVGIMQVVGRLAERSGVTLDVCWTVSTMTGILGLVAAGFGFGIVPAGLDQLRPDRILFVPLAEAEAQAGLCYVWRRDAALPALDRFLALARQD